ncbi:unnamed protein product [Lactuca virosa]|uniref:Uncharacterized protein n=1 Tax=Lactuca virosa TaxID=75947 RepID=A0AAU9MN62_9ASTR|nr:unnamed protein product [Lactuca virosa]
MTARQFKALNSKLDSLLEFTKASSINGYPRLLSKLTFTNNAIAHSKKTCTDTTEKVDKLLSDIKTFMEDFRSSSERNTASVNTAINSLVSTLQSKKAALTKVHTELQTNHSEFQTSISSKIEKL